jgi:hypothetical protein
MCWYSSFAPERFDKASARAMALENVLAQANGVTFGCLSGADSM